MPKGGEDNITRQEEDKRQEDEVGHRQIIRCTITLFGSPITNPFERESFRDLNNA